MTIAQQKKLLVKIQDLEQDIETLKKTRLEIATNGYASATLTSMGGSKSYSRIDLDKLTTLLKSLISELKSTRKLLSDNNSPYKTIVTIYS